MAADNLDIRIGTDLLEMKYVKAGTKVTMGAPGNIIGQLFNGELVACLLMYNKKQFDEMKRKLELGESAASSSSQSEDSGSQSST